MRKDEKIGQKEDSPGAGDSRHHGGLGKAVWEGSTMMTDKVGMVFLVNRDGDWMSLDFDEVDASVRSDHCTAFAYFGELNLGIDMSDRRTLVATFKRLKDRTHRGDAGHWSSVHDNEVVHWLPRLSRSGRIVDASDKIRLHGSSIIPLALPGLALPPSEQDVTALLDEAQAETEAGDEERVLWDQSLELLGLAHSAWIIETREQLIEAIAEGFPSSVIKALRRAGWTYELMDKVIVPRRTLMRRKATGQSLTAAESDAAWRLAYSLVIASIVFASREAALAWLTRSKDALKGRSPAELLQTSVGTDHVLSMLRRIDHGDFV